MTEELQTTRFSGLEQHSDEHQNRSRGVEDGTRKLGSVSFNGPKHLLIGQKDIWKINPKEKNNAVSFSFSFSLWVKTLTL